MSSSDTLGEASYDEHEFGARWWLDRAKDAVHRRAYQNIADAAQAAYPKAKVIIDYACGPGLLLAELAKRFPKAKLIGIDESQQMVDAAHIVLGARLGIERAVDVQVLRHPLPDFDLKLPKADVVAFSFPDFRDDLDGKTIQRLRKRFPKDWKRCRKVAKALAEAAAADDECDEEDDWITDVERLFFERCAARNIRKLLAKEHGRLVRVDYAPGERDEWIDPFLDRFDWTCGALEPGTCSGAGRKSDCFFRHEDSVYYRSKVIRDVYAQTGDDDHQTGGYLVSTLRRL